MTKTTSTTTPSSPQCAPQCAVRRELGPDVRVSFKMPDPRLGGEWIFFDAREYCGH
jgi:hypothetical protein